MSKRSSKCFKNQVGDLLTALSKMDIPKHKATAVAYVKRSLELIQQGWKGSVVFDKHGNIAAAAAYELFNGKVRIETLGSIGAFFEDGFTPGTALLYDIFNKAQDIGNGDVTLYSTPEAVAFYEKYDFLPDSVTDGRYMRAEKERYINFLNWFNANYTQPKTKHYD